MDIKPNNIEVQILLRILGLTFIVK